MIQITPKQVYAEKLIFLWIPSSFFHHLIPGFLETNISTCQELSRSYQVTPTKVLDMS